MPAPALLVDVGGTLVVREGGGLLSRVLVELSARRPDAVTDDTRALLARALQTGVTRSGAVEAVVAALPWAASLRGELEAVVGAPDGACTVLPGAPELLRAARAAGLRVVACTNAPAWQEPLPPAVAGGLDATVSSAEEGAVKQDPGFWAGLVARGAIDPAVSILVGDDPIADGAVPSRVGICSFVVGEALGLEAVSGWLARLGPPPDDALAVVGGRAERWAGQLIWPAAHLVSLVERVTRRRVSIHVPGREEAVRTMLVRRRGRPPALVVPPALAMEEGVAWLSARALARGARVPPDLAAAMAAARLSPDALGEDARRHLYSMVREAKDPVVREERIQDALRYLHDEAGTVVS